MKDLSALLGNIPPSATLAVSDKANALRAAGHDVIALAGGDPNFDTPQHIVDAAMAAIKNGATHYPSPTKGIHSATEAIAAKMERENGIKLDPKSDIVITPGGKWSLFLALAAMLNPGDEVLYLEPVWVSYPPMITLAGGVPVPVRLDGNDNFRITAAALEAKITPRTKALMVTTPNNPTGRVMTAAEMNDIVAVCVKHDLYCLADELYEKLIFDNHVHRSLGAQPGMAERTLTVNGLSKAYAMTGWRLGWLAGPTPVMKLAAKMHSQTITSAATFTMHACVAALNGPQDAVVMMREAYKKRRDFVVEALNEMPGIECASIEGAFYLFPKFTHTRRNSIDLAAALLDKAGVAGTPGSAFGTAGEGHLRFSIATAMADLERAVEKIAKVATEL